MNADETKQLIRNLRAAYKAGDKTSADWIIRRMLQAAPDRKVASKAIQKYGTAFQNNPRKHNAAMHVQLQEALGVPRKPRKKPAPKTTPAPDNSTAEAQALRDMDTQAILQKMEDTYSVDAKTYDTLAEEMNRRISDADPKSRAAIYDKMWPMVKRINERLEADFEARLKRTDGKSIVEPLSEPVNLDLSGKDLLEAYVSAAAQSNTERTGILGAEILRRMSLSPGTEPPKPAFQFDRSKSNAQQRAKTFYAEHTFDGPCPLYVVPIMDGADMHVWFENGYPYYMKVWNIDGYEPEGFATPGPWERVIDCIQDFSDDLHKEDDDDQGQDIQAAPEARRS
jgi:hypothetical protein